MVVVILVRPSSTGRLFKHCVVAFLGFGLRDVAMGLQEPPVVEPSPPNPASQTQRLLTTAMARPRWMISAL